MTRVVTTAPVRPALLSVLALLLGVVVAFAPPAGAQECPVLAPRPADETVTTAMLSTGQGEGFARFRVDAYGGSIGAWMQPIGYAGEWSMGGFAATFVVGTQDGNLTRQDLAAQWPYFHTCGLHLDNDVETHLRAERDVFVDEQPVANRRVTGFVMPSFPGLEVELVQEVCGNALTQTYTFHNPSGDDHNLTIIRASDLDVRNAATCCDNYAEEYPSGSGSDARGVTVWDGNMDYNTTLGAPLAGDATFDGWRIHQGGFGATMLAKAGNSYGFATTPWPGIEGDGLNGIWSHTAPHSSSVDGCGTYNFSHPQWCTPSALDVPIAASGLTIRRDVGVAIQWHVLVPAGGSASLVTDVTTRPGHTVCEMRAVVAEPTVEAHVDISHNCAHRVTFDARASVSVGEPSFTWFDPDGEVIATQNRFEMDLIAPVDGNFTVEMCNEEGVCDRTDKQVRITAPAGQCRCGDGWLRVGETCDDGNAASGDGCSSDCQAESGWQCPPESPPVSPVYEPGGPCTPECGDGIRVGAEPCDDANVKSGDGCSASCDVEPGWNCDGAQGCASICGDGRTVGDEDCDDGNAESGDGCASDCRVEAGWSCPQVGGQCAALCGDGVRTGPETCDDENEVAGDGCSSHCLVERGWTCDSPGAACTAICGDGLVLGAEGCDDGAAVSVDGDGCSASCAVESGWVCGGSPSWCLARCGDGDVVGDETCDDGNRAPGDGCSAVCRVESGWTCDSAGGCVATCGDGRIVGDETCDDGGTEPSDGCDAACAVEAGWTCPSLGGGCAPACGDGARVGDEACDDGNLDPHDGCSARCSVEAGWSCGDDGCASVCGDGVIVGPESCDDGGAPASGDGCNSDCQTETGWFCGGIPTRCLALCGDGEVVGGEACDDGGREAADGCSPQCQIEAGWACGAAGCAAICGDGIVAGPETCDDGGTAVGDGCDAGCRVESGWACAGGTACHPVCGDGRLSGGEACDDGGLLAGDGCGPTCEVESGWTCPADGACTTTCGDAVVAGAETCDDGGVDDGDGCASDCQVETGWRCDGSGCAIICGDGIVVGTEQCDDGNGGAGDGCDPACQVEAGWACSPGASCATVCGDGQRLGDEHCDDANDAAGDGCSPTCQVEDGWACDAAGCRTICSDGLVRGLEVCDDGNDAGGDGCAADCLTVELGWSCAPVGDPCVPLCGDGVVVGDELCDDGNRVAGDGCGVQCVPEAGWTCAEAGCQSRCGDGVVVGPEACDDGNVDDGDGCSSTCAIEATSLCHGSPSQCAPIPLVAASGTGGCSGGTLPALPPLIALLLLYGLAQARRRREG